MLSYATVIGANLSHLSTAVEKWKKLPGEFDKAATAFRTTVTKGLQDSNWKGETAKAAFHKFELVEKQLKAASDEAKDIHGLLDDALERFKSAKSRLEAVRTEVGDSADLRITEGGRVVPKGDPGDKDYEKAEKKHAEDITHFQERITRARKDATDADDALNWALQQDPNGAKHGFNSNGADSMKDALAGEKAAAKDADAAVKLASLDKLSDKQLAHLNAYLAKHKNDPVFGERFATELGPKKTLEFWRNIADPGGGMGPQAHPDRLKAVAKLQDNLSFTLAAATRTESPAMHQWENSVIKLGDNQFNGPAASTNAPFGYQVMSNLMRKGDFDDQFLDKYGKSLLHFENQQQEKNGMSPTDLWSRNRGQLNFGAENDFGSDPMTGLMESLGHSPDASTDFFNDKFEGGDGKQHSIFNYLVKGGDNNREWFVDGELQGEGKVVAGYKSMGHALEAATIGYPYDDKPSGAELTDHRNKDTADVMKKVIAAYTGDGDLMNKQQGVADSLGRMGAAYIDDINYGVSDYEFDHSGEYGSPEETRAHSPFKAGYKGALNISNGDAVDFLSVIARDKDAHAAVSMANNSYSLSTMMDNPPDRDEHGMLHYSEAKLTARVNATTQSVLDYTYGNQVASDSDAKLEDYKSKLETGGDWAGLVAGGASGLAVGMFNPAAGAVVAPVAADTAGEAFNTWFGEEYSAGADASSKKFEDAQDKDEVLKAYFETGSRRARIPGDIYAQNNGLSTDDRNTVMNELQESSILGYTSGKNITNDMGIKPYEHKEDHKWFGIF
ncbi:hypothetical protein ABT381_23490 [Streptomyces sp. NPDC000151]|uniref:hypothetical protein n=1 Tax=Streptomyces sp. NPDC000151 TaxID=3154244 RepID=UPI00332FD4D1